MRRTSHFALAAFAWRTLRARYRHCPRRHGLPHRKSLCARSLQIRIPRSVARDLRLAEDAQRGRYTGQHGVPLRSQASTLRYIETTFGLPPFGTRAKRSSPTTSPRRFDRVPSG